MKILNCSGNPERKSLVNKFLPLPRRTCYSSYCPFLLLSPSFLCERKSRETLGFLTRRSLVYPIGLEFDVCSSCFSLCLSSYTALYVQLCGRAVCPAGPWRSAHQSLTITRAAAVRVESSSTKPNMVGPPSFECIRELRKFCVCGSFVWYDQIWKYYEEILKAFS